jgi:hypothetical protein
MVKSNPPAHGQIATAQMPRAHAKQHLSEMTRHATAMKEYNGHGGGPETDIRLPGDIGQSSQGGFQQGGASGANYETTSVGDTPDADSQGPTGF